jgi:predicted CoA-binding protein
MLTLSQFIEEVAQKDLTVPPADVERMRERLGDDKVTKMGHLQEDGSMLVPVDCVLDVVQSLGPQALTEAAEILKSDEMVNMLQSGETLVELVGKARERRLRELIRKFQSESNETDARRQWRQIEKTVFGVDYADD